MSGWYAMKRGWLEHEMFSPVGRWSKAEAWVWLVENACFKPTSVDLGGKPHSVPRGSLCHSLRFMATKWRWSTKAVQTFLRDLEAHGVVKFSVITGGHGGETRRTQITLCNYHKYQSTGNAQETREKRTGNKEEQGNKETTSLSEESGDSEPIRVSLVTTTLWAMGKQYLSQHGIQNSGSLIGRWLKTSEPLQIIAAIDAAQKSGTQDPIPYITEALKGNSNVGKSASKSKARFDAFMSGARETS